jgi:hypothetical protein
MVQFLWCVGSVIFGIAGVIGLVDMVAGCGSWGLWRGPRLERFAGFLCGLKPFLHVGHMGAIPLLATQRPVIAAFRVCNCRPCRRRQAIATMSAR